VRGVRDVQGAVQSDLHRFSFTIATSPRVVRPAAS
jgi:hypothetical protein